MGKFYKGIEYVSNPKEEVVYHKNQSFSEVDDGISTITFRSESLDWDSNEGLISYSSTGSHYNLVKYILNDSASFEGYANLHKNKFYSSGSVVYIPQKYYGEQIKPKTFTLTDNSTSKEIIIKDDGRGNLYSTNASFSQSVVTSVSSSDNYVGNIHYEAGVVLMTETASWSGSVNGNSSDDINYTDVGTGNFNLKFNSTMTIHQNELVLRVKAHEFNATANPTIWKPNTSKLLDNISSSLENFTPYITSLAFYQQQPSVLFRKSVDTNNTEEYTGDDVVTYDPFIKPVLVAKFPKPVRVSNTDDLTIIIKYDT